MKINITYSVIILSVFFFVGCNFHNQREDIFYTGTISSIVFDSSYYEPFYNEWTGEELFRKIDDKYTCSVSVNNKVFSVIIHSYSDDSKYQRPKVGDKIRFKWGYKVCNSENDCKYYSDFYDKKGYFYPFQIKFLN